MKKTLLCILLSTAFLLCAAPISYAEETAAKELTGTLEFYSWDTADTSPLTDSNEGSCATIGYTGSLTITSQEPIATSNFISSRSRGSSKRTARSATAVGIRSFMSMWTSPLSPENQKRS